MFKTVLTSLYSFPQNRPPKSSKFFQKNPLRPSQPEFTEEAKATSYELTVMTPKSVETKPSESTKGGGITFSQGPGEAAINSDMVQAVEDEMKVRKKWLGGGMGQF